MPPEDNDVAIYCPSNSGAGSIAWYATISPISEPASWPPQEEVLRHQQVPDTLQARRDATFVHMPISFEGSWDSAGDDQILRYFYRDRSNLVLDSVFPLRVPHIVITPAEDSWDDQCTAWQNRVDTQWEGNLVVPQMNLSEYLCLTITLDPLLDSFASSNGMTSLPASSPPKPVFSHSQFKQSKIKSASAEYHIPAPLHQTLQKAQCKAVFLAAGHHARSFRKRYDLYPNVLSKIDPVFVWSDPAEPILISSVGLLGTIIIDSSCPFTLPHIIINSPPPHPPQLTENNAAPLVQDAAFGQRLTVQSHLVEIINSAEDWDYCYSDQSYLDSSGGMSYDESFVDQMESDSESRPETPAPGTPVDEEGGGFFCIDHPEGFKSITQVEVGADIYKTQDFPRSQFFIDEDEDDLPSLDDW